jgi:hypothetical protein
MVTISRYTKYLGDQIILSYVHFLIFSGELSGYDAHLTLSNSNQSNQSINRFCHIKAKRNLMVTSPSLIIQILENFAKSVM